MLRPKSKKQEKVKLTPESYKKARKLFHYLKPYRLEYGIGWIFLVFSTSLGLVFPILLGQLLGLSSGSQTSMAQAIHAIDLSNVSTVAIALFMLFASQAIFSYFRVVLFTNAAEKALRDLRKDVFHKMLHLPMDFFNSNSVGELTSRISSDITQIQETLRTTIAEFFRQVVMVVGGIFYLTFVSPKLSLIMLSVVPIITVAAVLFGKFIKRLSREAQDQTAKANAVAEESFTGIGNIKSFTNENFLFGRFNIAVEEIKRLNVKSGIWRGLFISFMVFCMFGSIVFVIWQGLLMTQGAHPEMTQGDLFSFLMVTLMMAASIGSLPEFYASIQKTIGGTEKLISILNEKPENELFKGTEFPEIDGTIRFDDVHFSYPQRVEVEVLKGINFELKKNQTLALVGSSGGGKTTISSLILSYYKVNKGAIYFGDTNSELIDVKHLRKHIAIVPQEVLLFAGTIFDNIAFGDPSASKTQVKEAAKQANALEFIEGFPDGFQTQVGDRGVQLSGGQKQRIAIARAILKNPKILILDEATSALDAASERIVQDALDTLMKGRTCVVIAHRLSTIRNADSILVLQNGTIVEQGNHDELMAKNGVYLNLVRTQITIGNEG